MTKCMVCGDEFDPYYKAQRLCQSCLDKFTKRYWDWNEYRKQGHTRRPTCIVCDKPLTRGFSVCPDCRDTWKKNPLPDHAAENNHPGAQPYEKDER